MTWPFAGIGVTLEDQVLFLALKELTKTAPGRPVMWAPFDSLELVLIEAWASEEGESTAETGTFAKATLVRPAAPALQVARRDPEVMIPELRRFGVVVFE